MNDCRSLSIDRRPLSATTPHDVTVYKPYLFLEFHNCKSARPSVYVYDQRAVSFTSSDAGQLGKETSNGWTTYDAWDVFVARVHGGSERAALENYCEVSGYNQVKLHTIVKKWGQS